MSEEPCGVRWLSDSEMLAWRSYVVSTLMLRQRLHRELAERHAISLTDYEVLVCLSGADGNAMRMSELATMLGSTKSRLSHQIGRMELLGYVRRRRLPGDRRAVMAALTEQGAEMLRRSAPTHVEGVREHFVDLLTPDEHESVGKAFTKVQAHLLALAK